MKKLVVLLLALAVIGVAVVAQDAAAPSVVWHMNVYTGAGVTNNSIDSSATMIPYNYTDEYSAENQLNATWTSADKNSGLVFRGEFSPTATTYNNPASNGGGFGYRYAYGFTSFANGLVTIQGGRLGVSPINTGMWMNPLDTEGANAGYFGINPIPGLAIGTVVYFPPSSLPATDGGNQLATDLYGFNYTMPNAFKLVGLFQGSTVANSSTLAAGFSLLAVQNLTANVEIKVTNLGSSANGTGSTTPALVGAGSVFTVDEQFGYPVGNLGLTLYASQATYKDVTGASLFQYNIEPSVAYKLTDVTSVGLIANVYSYPLDVAGTFLSPLDGGPAVLDGTSVQGQSEAVAFGIGPQVTFTQGAGTLIIGDYIGIVPSYGPTASGTVNFAYVSMNFAL
jgi:hypothetical protein